LGFLVQSCKYDFKNQKRTSNVQYIGLSKFVLSKIFHQLKFSGQTSKSSEQLKKKNSILLIYLNDIHHRPPPYYSTR